MRIQRIISNNAVLAHNADGDEVVVLGLGVGFGRRAEDEVESSRVERVFLADTSDARLPLMLVDTPLPCLRAAGRLAELAHERLGISGGQSLILPLADHLAFAWRRAQEGVRMQFPLLWEVSQLYPAEFEVGQAGVLLAEEELEISIDPDEAVAIAMHLVNVQFVVPGHTNAMLMTETIARTFTLIEHTYDLDIDRRSMNAARFVTHLRYVFARITSGQQINERHPTLFDAISNAHPQAMQCAVKVTYLIEVAFSTSLTLDETAYLGLHVARLLADHDLRKTASPSASD